MATKGLTEITVWYRGITEGKISRDIVNSLAKAAEKEGNYTQAFDNYGDLPDRVYVPCRSYARISDTPIAEPYLYENDNPAIVAVVEATMVKGVHILKGMRPGGVLVVNSDREPEELIEHMKDMDLSGLAAVAAVSGGRQAKMGDATGSDEVSTDVSGVGAGAAGPMAVTSANVSGQASPSTAEEVLAQLGGRIELILDGGKTPGGLPSTVVDCTGSEPVILRAGPVALSEIKSILG